MKEGKTAQGRSPIICRTWQDWFTENPVELKRDDIERMELKIQETQDQICIVKVPR